MFRRPRALVQLLALTLSLAGAARGGPPVSSVPVHEVEAQFIERFTRFIEWPPSSFAAADAPFVVCTWGEGPLSTELERVVSGRRIKARPVRVLRVDAIDKLAPCHVLYLAKVERDLVRRVGSYALGKPLLTIGDQPGLAEAGLMINLVVDSDGFVRFEINRAVVNASQLRVSAKLMRLARLVETRR
jgi:hypothetical protein